MELGKFLSKEESRLAIRSFRQKYSDALDARFSTKDGTNKPYEMGCFGIGVSRILRQPWNRE